jgi:2-dehydropantoate 2-reductase
MPVLGDDVRVSIIGAGAIGLLLAGRLARSGCDVSLLVRGEPPLALRQNLVRLVDDSGDHAVAVRLEHAPSKLGRQDLVILAVKAHAIAGTLEQVAPLLGPDTIILTAVNGVPWWFFEGHEPARRLRSVDADGRIAEALKHQPLVGCVLFPAAQLQAPGMVRHLSGNRIVFGNPRPTDTQAAAVAHLFTSAGFETPIAPDIRAALWAKLVGNATINPLSVITGATIRQMAKDFNLSAILTSAMAEIDAVGAAIHIEPMMTQADRLKLAASVGHHKTSMLQDYEAGRTLEVSPLLGAVGEIAQLHGVPTPILDTFDHLVAAKLSVRGNTI